MNIDPSTVKNSANMMSQMSDEELRRTASSMPNIPGMPPGGIDPQRLREMSKMMNGMDDEQIKRMTEMAQSMGYGPTGGMPNMNRNPTNAYQSSQSGSSVPKKVNEEDDPFSKPEELKKFESVTGIKDKANELFKNNKLVEASEKYYEAINIIRTTN